MIEELRALPAVSIPSWPARSASLGLALGSVVLDGGHLVIGPRVGGDRLPHLLPLPLLPLQLLVL